MGEGRLPLSGGDVERSETEGVGDLAAGQTDEGEKTKGLPQLYKFKCALQGPFSDLCYEKPLRQTARQNIQSGQSPVDG